MREEFEKMAAAGKIEGRHVEALVKLVESGYCQHKSWGFGQIKSVDPVFAKFTIDFPGKPGHTMALTFAAESLKPIPKDHILARKATDPAGLQELAAKDHLGLVKLVLLSNGGKATQDQIQQALVPDVIKDDWKKWWEAAKRELKKSGHFLVPAKKSEPIVYQAQEISMQDRLLEDFRKARGLKAKVVVANEIAVNAADLTDKVAAANEVIPALNAEIPSYQRTQPGVALEAIFVRNELRAAAGTPVQDGELTEDAIWAQEPSLSEVMEGMPATRHRKALESFKATRANDWADTLLKSINTIPTRTCKEFASLLIHEGKIGDLKLTLRRLITQHAASSELLLWFGRERSEDFADILGPEVFRAMLTAMERDQFNEKRSSKLRDYILSDQQLVVELISSADIELIKDMTRALQYSPVFDDLEKRLLLGWIVKTFPVIQPLISGTQTRQDTTLIVSWESLERAKNEYHELVEKKIPANSKEIALARSYGDLSENHEFKAAKEMQTVLMRRKGELEVALDRARGSDFANVSTDLVSIGTIVHLTDLEANKPETLTILGAWDDDADKGIISYLTPVAQALMNKKVGESVEYEVHGVRHHHRIENIEAYNKTVTPPVENAPAAEAPSAAA
jgi:transcription elongation GreA/GreB family factor